jgi:hypothetical protein
MDHARIDAAQTADRYLMGKLTDEEQRLFEEHFLDCPTCLEKIETVEGLRAGLNALTPVEVLAGHGTARTNSVDRPGFFARPLVPFLLAAGWIVAIAPALFFWSASRRTHLELARFERTVLQAQSRESELERAIERERAAHAKSGEPGTVTAAPVVASAFMLDVTRGSASGEPENRVVVDEAPGWIVLLFDRPDRAGFSNFRVRLTSTEGRPIGERIDAGTASGGMLAVSLPSAMLASGDYVLAVEGTRGARTDTLVTYRFRVSRKS